MMPVCRYLNTLSLSFILLIFKPTCLKAASGITRGTVISRRTANDYAITKYLSNDVFEDAANSSGIPFCLYDGGELIFSNPMSLKPSDKFYDTGIMQQRAMEMMVDEINTSPRCGIDIKGEKYSITLLSYGDDSSKEKAHAIADYAAIYGPERADFLLGPYSSGLTGASVAPVANKTSTLLIAGGAAVTSIFEDRPTVFGTLPPTNKYLSDAIEGLSEVGAKTIVAVWESPAFTKGACSPLQSLANQYNMTYLAGFEVADSPSGEHFDPIVQNISKADMNPDVVVSCVYDAGCAEWIRALRRADWNPKAQVLTVCIGKEELEEAVGDDVEFMMGVTPWDSSIFVIDALTGWTATEFSDRFYSKTKRKATYHAASAAASLGIIVQAIEKSESGKGQAVTDIVSKEIFSTLYGDISFDINGQSKAHCLLVQYDGSKQVQTVYPKKQKSANLIYPMPPWSSRDCVKLSDCLSNGNSCTSKGICSCNDTDQLSVGIGANASCRNIPIEEYTHISTGLKIVGYSLTGLQIALSFTCIVWTYVRRKHPVVKSSQPLFLGLIAFGTMVIATAIIPIGIEGQYRYKQDPITRKVTSISSFDIDHVDRACMAFYWLLGIGYTILFSALFAKIQRVERLMKAAATFRRKIIKTKDVLHIMLFMLGIQVILLLLWQFIDPSEWHRTVLKVDDNEYPLISVGRCTHTYFSIPFLAINATALFGALFRAVKLRDLPSELHEGSWIILSLGMTLELLVLGIPIFIISHDSPDTYYLVRVGILFLLSFTITCFIFIPKMYRIYFQKAPQKRTKERRHNMSADVMPTRWKCSGMEGVSQLSGDPSQYNDVVRRMSQSGMRRMSNNSAPGTRTRRMSQVGRRRKSDDGAPSQPLNNGSSISSIAPRQGVRSNDF